MILSHSKKFIFIHIYKVAGTSIRKVLQPYSDSPKDNLSLIKKVKFGLGGRFHFLSQWSMDHLKASEIKSFLPDEIWRDYFKFSFVRNPWDWQVSLYHFMLQDENHHQHKLINKMKNFEEYIEWRVKHSVELQKSFLYDAKGNCLVDYIGKFENLQQDFNEALSKIGIKEVQLPVLNTSLHRYYKEYYNDYTRDLIAEAFKEDITLFNYEF